MGEGEYRARPIAYEGSLAAGETQVTVPIKASIDGGHYVVTESKTYTYYTCDYVAKHRDLIEDAAMISPMDVANYYSVFQEAPANYGASSGGAYDAAIAVFGDMARRVSTYTRKDGYAKCIPYAVDSKKNLPIYHEFDIALNEDYGKSRGVGRLVAFETGLAVDSYDQGSYPVCYYTDDHYATFQEYGNLGEFLPRFAAEQNVIDVAWGEPSLVTASITGLAGEISLE